MRFTGTSAENYWSMHENIKTQRTDTGVVLMQARALDWPLFVFGDFAARICLYTDHNFLI